MKKVLLTACLLLCSGVAFADGNAFTPLNFDEAPAVQAPAKPVAQPANAPAATEEAIGNGNIQNAILQLDNAQVDIRNDLLNLKTKYADVDAQYKLVKAERKTLGKQIKSIEKRIKSIDNAKEKIRKNML